MVSTTGVGHVSSSRVMGTLTRVTNFLFLLFIKTPHYLYDQIIIKKKHCEIMKKPL